MPEHSQVHLPLPETSSIRLLFIEPGAFAEPLKVRLEVFPDLETCPPFNALSYTWGDPKLVETISCNGTDVSIGKNLADALRRFRASTPNYQHDAIWADALCINQDDLLEKTHQVRLMRRIYQKAGRVLIWLGPDTGDFDDAL
ncbi:heterokaryon incompatibility protein-domain-containing protein, partial [Cercophora newfieldiana]